MDKLLGCLSRSLVLRALVVVELLGSEMSGGAYSGSVVGVGDKRAGW